MNTPSSQPQPLPSRPFSIATLLRACLSLGFSALLAAGFTTPASLQAQTNVPPPTTMYLLKAGGILVTTTVEKPTVVNAQATLSGVVIGDVLVAIDVRPQNQLLYALGVNANANTLRLYRLVPESGMAFAIGNPTGFLAPNLTAIDMPEGGYEMDFDPAFDRLRVVTTSGLNFRLDPNTGAAIDGNLGSNLVIAGVNTDSSINGGSTIADGTAYTNNQPNNGGITTLYTLSGNELLIQNPPNSGSLAQAKLLKEKGSPVSVSEVNGFDIAPGSNATISGNAVPSGSGLAILKNATSSRLCRIDLTNANVTALGNVTAISFALRTDQEAALGLSGSNLLRFNPYKPGTVITQGLINLNGGEEAVALDMRPTTGQIYVLGINAANNNGTLYLLDPQSGQLTAQGGNGSIAFLDAMANPVDLPPGSSGYEMDFNPTVDRIRVVTGSGLNFRVNPNNGAPVDGGAETGTNPDTAISFNNQATGVHGAAYTNSSPVPANAVTTLYTLSSTQNCLFIQNPPNAGVQTQQKFLTNPYGQPFNLDGPVGFDIPASVKVTTDNTAVTDNGTGFFTGTANGSHLFRVNLTTGVVHDLGSFPVTVKSLALMNLPPQAPLQIPALPVIMVSQQAQALVDIAPGATVSAKGLPPGLTLNAKTGIISGRASAAGIYQVTFTAKKGTQTVSYIATFVVQALPAHAVGTFIAYLPPSDGTTDTAGRLDLTVTGKGSYTLKFARGTKTYSGTGYLVSAAGDAPHLNHALGTDGSLLLAPQSGGQFIGSYINIGAQAMTGWRRTFDKVFNPAVKQAGYYNIILNQTQNSATIPPGYGFASVLIGEDGSVKFTGKSSDGVALTSASFLGPQNNLIVHAPTYLKKGAVSGVLNLGVDGNGNYLENGIEGNLTMRKPATSGRTYPAEILTGILNIEGKYSARAPTGSIVLGLPSSEIPSSLDFSAGGVEASATATDLVDSVQYLRPALKVVVPAPGTINNPAKVSLTINATTGASSGSFTLVDGTLKRTVKYEGLVVRTFTGDTLIGFFLLPQIPQGIQTISNSPILSGKVRLIP